MPATANDCDPRESGRNLPPRIEEVLEKPRNSRAFAVIVSRNIVASLARVFVVSLVALGLPAYLTHRLPVTTYAAWVLILQLGAYVSYFDLGIQTGVSKFVAEYDAKGDYLGAGRHASAGLLFMSLGGTLGLILTVLLAWQVPRLFRTMPANLYHDVRFSLVLIGASLSFGLVCAVYSAVFLGLQRYWTPMTITIINRLSYAVVIVAVVAFRGSLVAMGIAVAVVNVVTGLLQVIAWHQKARYIPISTRLMNYGVLKKVTSFCSLQSVWTLAMLCIAGLDLTIVGHYDYPQTAYYSIAILPTSFILMIMASMLGPLMPASSAMSTQRSPQQMGELLARITRYSTLVLLLTGLPLMVWGYPILRLWVGPEYALHTLTFLRILILANIIRNLCAPYATMIVATNRQGAAIAAAVSEAAINLGSSIFLASRFGAIGVAIGTLLGAFVSVLLHFAITMRFTRQTLSISRAALLVKGMLRPAMVVIPSLLILPFWSANAMNLNITIAFAWGACTLMLAWYAALNTTERDGLTDFFRTRLAIATSA